MAEKKIESDNETEAGDAAENEESMIGNICNLQVLPPGYYGSPEQGHLVFNASFESGNLGRVDAISEHEFDLFIRPDTCNVRYRVWLYFSVSNTRVNQRVIFNVVNFSKTKSLFREGMTPMVKSTSRPKWQKLPVKQCYYYRSPEHQKNYVLSFAFVFDIEEVYEFSYCYPYTYTDLQDYLDVIEEQDLPFFKRELLGVTVQQRRLDLLTITRPSNFDDDVMKRVVFISARVHPGETPASYMCQGLIDFLISHNELADVLRKYLVFKIVPMLNPDGVYLGNYRCSLMGYDLNRYWSDPSAWAHPALYTTKQYLTALGQNENVQLDFFIDLHAHSTLLNAFMFGNAFDDSGRMEKQSVFPRLMSVNVEDFSLSNTNFNNDELKSGTGRR
ncbi:PREDICTED: cytosolic carboxypeptidase 6-like [Priapulus caudatus]|uniref:Cytosolic carboxypeptidase 6-like n=1 Tax=Priapulus caudatus TaxID=37621 RepID=A0ABM1ED44_PRICU|nr:PREDICTED: cytosolic carboxypeptidase 6-like [Priapulus caudatus]